MAEYASPTQDPNSPAYESESYRRQIAELQIVRDFRKGTAHLRTCSTKYLTRFPAEEAEAYNYRLKQSLIHNDTETTLQALVGRVFKKPPEFDATDVPVEIAGQKADEQNAKVEGWGENIDLQGTHWQVFAKEVATDAIGDGHAFIYVDMPPKLPEGSTLADEKAAGIRPYWVKYKKDQAINWIVETMNNRPRLAQITFKEMTCEKDGAYGEKSVTRYRVLRPGSWELYLLSKDANGKEQVTLETSGPSSLTEIPVVPIYGGKQTGFLESFPCLEPLAQIECSRYNLYSDYRTGIHMILPAIVRKGDGQTNKINQVGWHTIFDVDKDGDVAYMSVDGAGLTYFENDLKALDQRMAIFGLQLESAPTVQKTATEIVTSDQKADAPLTSSAQSLKDGLEMALLYLAKYGGLATGGSVILDYLKRKQLVLSPQAVTALNQAASNGHLDTQTFLEILHESGWLAENADVQEILKRLEAAAEKAAERAASVFNQGGNPGEMDA